eukprot:scaffold34049_cov71-Cyclotella_meneghiniana.AAC.5
MVGSVGDWRRGLPLRVERHPFSDNSVQMEGFYIQRNLIQSLLSLSISIISPSSLRKALRAAIAHSHSVDRESLIFTNRQ